MIVSQPNGTRRRVTVGLVAMAGYGLYEGAFGQGRFKLFDALLHRGKPNLQRLGLEPLPTVEHIWRDDSARDDVEEDGIVRALRQLPPRTETFFLDIENWPLLKTTPEVRQQSIRKLIQVARIVRRHTPAAKFGFYCLPPAGTYWPLVDTKTYASQRAEWLVANRELEPLAELVDFLFPSLYTFFDDRGGWLTYARETLNAARRYGKPVYPFLWSEYHDSNLELRDHEVDPDAWREELQFCRAHADGIVFWGGYHFGGGGYRRGWSESAAWWQEVRREFDLGG